MVSTNSSSPLGHRGALSFSNSLRLTRTIRAGVQKLLSRYVRKLNAICIKKPKHINDKTICIVTFFHFVSKCSHRAVLFSQKQQVFGDELFEYRELMLSSLPAVTVSYQSWLHMQDTERLRLASHNLQTFWTHLEVQRQQLERERDATNERREQRRGKRGKPQSTLRQSFVSLQIDLRDLMKQVNSQVQTSVSLPQPTLASAGFIFTGGSVDTQQTTTAETSSWIQHLRGYVILRDLERYLSRLARDYAVLQAKY
uniref:Uncharacterized LOC107663373 n=1 Tax=Sinocyclocheilus anshuiensis TaxID=1608454 RepID=A0A671LCU0_9TELE